MSPQLREYEASPNGNSEVKSPGNIRWSPRLDTEKNPFTLTASPGGIRESATASVEPFRGGASKSFNAAPPHGRLSLLTRYRTVKTFPAKISSGKRLDKLTVLTFCRASLCETNARPTIMAKIINRKLFAVPIAVRGIQKRRKIKIHPNRVGRMRSLSLGCTLLMVEVALMIIK